MTKTIEIKVSEYQTQEDYISLNNIQDILFNIRRPIGKLITKGYSPRGITLVLDCSECGRIKHSALYHLFETCSRTKMDVKFSNTGLLRSLNYEGIRKKYKKRQKRQKELSDKFERLKETSQKEIKIDSVRGIPYYLRNLVKNIFYDLFKVDLEYLKKSMENTKHEQDYKKRAKEEKLKIIIERLCEYEEVNLKSLEAQLLKLEEECKNKYEDLEEKTVFVFNGLNNLGLIDDEQHKTLTLPFREKDIKTEEDLENIILDLKTLIGFVCDSQKDYKWKFIKESEAIKVTKTLRKLLEHRGEKIIKRYNTLIN